MYRILVCDDEEEIVSSLTACLTAEGYQVVTARTGWEVLNILSKQPIHLALLGTKLPGLDGLTTVTRLRQMHDLPVILLTSGTDSTENILGLTIGADDYITKPFNPLEVVARVKTQLRRYIRYNQTAPEPAPAAVYDCGGLYIDHESHTCTLYGKPLSLTPLEFEILWYLCSRKGHVVSSEELFEAVWGEKYLDNNNTVMAHIARLREKMGELPRKPKWIKTVWGVGYKIDE